MRSTELLVGSLVDMFPPLFCEVYLETSNGLMPAAAEHRMMSRRLIVPGVEHAMEIIGVDMCLLVLRPKWYIVLQVSRIMNAPGILWTTPPVHLSNGGHWKARSLVWNLLFLFSLGPDLVWWWLLLRKPHSWALSLHS